MFTLKTFLPPAAVLSLGLAWTPVHAQTSWSSELVDFTLVGGDPGALGEPEIVSDDTGVSLNFNPRPLSFDALSDGNGQVDTEIIGFTLRATAAPNQRITGVSWSENGVYQVTGNGSWVSAFSSLRVADAQTHETIGDIGVDTFFAQGTNDGVNGGPWNLNVNQALAANQVEIELTVKDILAALAPENGFGWIEKDFGGLRVDVAPIPLPASVWLLGSALFGLIMIGRRRSGRAQG
ncbi:conserved exported protein of unknown function [Methylocaldum szegediense]|uniref:Secreted protein n=1 Tax=Methylocaldum szegediense TaxID=73780 RepID=A0ABM9I2E1_9GAMM|nr:VPLPA-CTERM sorting domain-containing protein [Methylocaldum szegediense]CAI8846324.1 conserved exported protein of unknown function [Methylocaldum szegediense]